MSQINQVDIYSGFTKNNYDFDTRYQSSTSNLKLSSGISGLSSDFWVSSRKFKKKS